jgi:DNA-binding response OmpR family regulator
MHTAAHSILLLGNDEGLLNRIIQDLHGSGYPAVAVTQTGSSWQQFSQLQPALVVVDFTEAGLLFCRQVRSVGSKVPILLLLGHETLEDRVACLESGADDYLVKPYRLEAFLQMVRFYLEPSTGGNEQLRFADLVLDLHQRRAIRGDRTLELTMKEFELLKYLMSNPGEVLTREQILENVWGYDFIGASNVIEVYVRYLRLKIEDEGERRLIQTVRGVGYVLRESQN